VYFSFFGEGRKEEKERETRWGLNGERRVFQPSQLHGHLKG
jgi:hypothetical protein